MHRVKYRFLNPRTRSLLRGSILVLASLIVSLLLSDFPHNRPSLMILLPAIVASIGIVDTVRCMQRRWSFYHAGVVLCIYMDLMALSMILFLLIYPYATWITSSR